MKIFILVTIPEKHNGYKGYNIYKETFIYRYMYLHDISRFMIHYLDYDWDCKWFDAEKPSLAKII